MTEWGRASDWIV